MTTISGVWKFRRDTRSIEGFLSTSRPSTDALNALESWRAKNFHRAYEVKTENDELLLAELSTNSDDDEAGGDLDRECCRVGLIRERRE